SIFLARRSLSEFQLGRSLACEQVCRTLSHGDRRTLRRRTLRAHLRDCGDCAEFARAIEARRAELRTLTPALAGPLAAGAVAPLAAGSNPGTGVLAKWSATKTAATTLTAKAAAATASAIALTAGVGAGVAIALVQAEGRPPGAPSPAHHPHKVSEVRSSSSAERHRDHRRAPHGHGPGTSQAVTRAGAPSSPAPPSGSLEPRIPTADSAGGPAAGETSGPGRRAAAADAAPRPGRLGPPGSAGGDGSAGSEKRGRGNVPGERGRARGEGAGTENRGRGHSRGERGRARGEGAGTEKRGRGHSRGERGRARARGQDMGGVGGKPPRADDPPAGSARAHEQRAGNPGSREAPPPSQAESHSPRGQGANAPATTHGQEHAASSKELKQESPPQSETPQPETPQLGEATGAPSLPAVPSARAA